MKKKKLKKMRYGIVSRLANIFAKGSPYMEALLKTPGTIIPVEDNT